MRGKGYKIADSCGTCKFQKVVCQYSDEVYRYCTIDGEEPPLHDQDFYEENRKKGILQPSVEESIAQTKKLREYQAGNEVAESGWCPAWRSNEA